MSTITNPLPTIIACQTNQQGFSAPIVTHTRLSTPSISSLNRRSSRGSRCLVVVQSSVTIVAAAGNGSEPEEPEVNAVIGVKISLAESSGKLDMSDCELTKVPPEVFDLTDLEELSLAGNQLTELPADIRRLTSLKRLQLSGNQLHELPHDIGALQHLEGLWLHGNYLDRLPESLGQLTALTQLSLSGNNLAKLPEETSSLRRLKDLSVAGNRLESLPAGLGELVQLEKLSLHGNRICELPSSLTGLTSLKELWLMGNPNLALLPECLGKLPALEHLSLADCRLMAVPSALGRAQNLKSLTLYGNNLHTLPKELLDSPQLQYLWVEGNPLLPEVGAALAKAAAAAGPAFKTLGLDEAQAGAIPQEILSQAGDRIKVSYTVPSPYSITGLGKNGYFKLERSGACNNVLVVAFGSAPGTPNWVGCLNKVRSLAPDPRHNDFDSLFVVDPARSWYGGGDESFLEYEARLKEAINGYQRVVMVGDSMGATAALLFSHLATSSHAFCPQIDLRRSSIRPANGSDWYDRLNQRVLEGISNCLGKVVIHTGNWAHDLEQANVVPRSMENLHVQIYSIDSHRLAIALDRVGKLAAILRGAISQELELPYNGTVRISNMF